jgi:hypothetical protein
VQEWGPVNIIIIIYITHQLIHVYCITKRTLSGENTYIQEEDPSFAMMKITAQRLEYAGTMVLNHMDCGVERKAGGNYFTN